MKSEKLSVVIPVYNEAKKVGKTVARLDRFFSKKTYPLEYVFVEDGSSDDTLNVLRGLKEGRDNFVLLTNKKNMGKGYSIRRGMLASTGARILFMDADMSTPLRVFQEFEKYLDGYDIVMGSRWIRESNIRIPQPWFRRAAGKVFYMIIRAFFLKGITDTNCGFKCYQKAVARDIFSKQLLKGWGFDVELLFIAQKRGYHIREVPVIWAHGRDSRVDLIKVPFLTLLELLRIRINDWNGRYEK
ncbi:MAG: dolichyl-phosphate beta-glucosyltransferase [Candidatus Omnitrophota bacterium]